jgi:hypothetical protein
MSEIRKIAAQIINKRYYENVFRALVKGISVHERNNEIAIVFNDGKKYLIKFCCLNLSNGNSNIDVLGEDGINYEICTAYEEYKNIPLLLKALQTYVDALPANKAFTPENIGRLDSLLNSLSCNSGQYFWLFTGGSLLFRDDVVYIQDQDKVAVMLKNEPKAIETEDSYLSNYDLWDMTGFNLNGMDGLDLKEKEGIKKALELIKVPTANMNGKNDEMIWKIQTYIKMVTFIDANELIAEVFKKAYASLYSSISDLMFNVNGLVKNIRSWLTDNKELTEFLSVAGLYHNIVNLKNIITS